jgi:hypothetical protein
MSLNWSSSRNGGEESRECYCGRRYFGCAQYDKCVNVAANLYTKWEWGLRLWKNFINKPKKEKRSNVFLFVSWGLFVALLFTFMSSCVQFCLTKFNIWWDSIICWFIFHVNMQAMFLIISSITTNCLLFQSCQNWLQW